jgi:methionyl-tRNA formyltransferase
MKTYILLTEKKWHDSLFEKLSNSGNFNWIRISKKSDFDLEKIDDIKPEIIFIPHWSYIIPESIFIKYTCIVFHMTDLPFGRGGSPLQNLICRGIKETKVSAIKVVKELDAGDVYLKMTLELYGTAQEIFLRSVLIIEKMIMEIINNSLQPQSQKGEVVEFKRRKKEDGNIKNLETITDVYDYIRMLDCEGYPNAFLETENFRFEFSRASFKDDQTINADVRIIKK